MGDRKVIGKYGEDLATKYLQAQGYQILERNYRCNLGEIDIVAQDKDYLVFVEVKTRTNVFFGFPHESVTHAKQSRIRKIALFYLAERRSSLENYRFDVISVLLEEGKIDNIELIRNAF